MTPILLALALQAPVAFDSSSTLNQSSCVPVATRDQNQVETVVVAVAEGNNVSIPGVPWGDAKVRVYDSDLLNPSPITTIAFDWGGLDAASNQFIPEGYVLVGGTKWAGNHPDTQVRLLDSNGSPMGVVLTLAASSSVLQGVAEGSHQSSAGFKQGWFVAALDGGDVEVWFCWPDPNGVAQSYLSFDFLGEFREQPNFSEADVRSGDQHATIAATKALGDQLVTANSSDLVLEYLVDTHSAPLGIPALSSPTAGYRAFGWTWWELGAGYRVQTLNWRANGNPALPLRDHGFGFDPHFDRDVLVWGTENDIRYWKDDGMIPNSGSFIAALPVTHSYLDDLEPSVSSHPAFSNDYVGWTQKATGGNNQAMIVKF